MKLRKSTMIAGALAVTAPIVAFLGAMNAIDQRVAACFLSFVVGFALANMLNA